MSLEPLLASRRVILVVGSGGVGKTTTTAALGLAAAVRGKRVLCLTIDPARRLANSLGLKAMTTEAQTVDAQRFSEAGLHVAGSLTVMMLDTKSTFDELVHRYASSPQARDRILHNRLYQYVSTSLAGTHEYMAMEKLHAVKTNGLFDLILLDTPPTTNALDFLDAPQRLVDALDSAAMRWFIEAFQESGKLSFNILAKSAAIVLKGIGKLTGGDFLEQVAQFVTDLNDLFGGFKERAQEVARTLRAPDVAYVLVTSPSPMAIQEVLFFSERLEEQGMPRDALVVNRLHVAPSGTTSVEAARQAIQSLGLILDEDAPERLTLALEDERRQAQLDGAHLLRLEEALARSSKAPLRIHVPALPYDVHDLRTLAEVAHILVP
ncbi:MAG: ArsA-related P-loop ATPase [Myxococcales bacterium]|nr:AAA family ATPase [Polyangiaceae bacterium]MDW8251543.1 ArsA-related P-loop ATPase [Myxococcales bacterium]